METFTNAMSLIQGPDKAKLLDLRADKVLA